MSTTETAEAPPKKKKGKKKLLIIVVGVLVLAGGIGGYLTFGTSKKPAAPKAGAVVPLAAITVNLSDGHFLKVSIALQMTAAAGTETPEGSKALDLLIRQFSNKSVAELSSNDAREEAKKKLAEHVGEAYEGHVMEVYLTEFVMQ